MERNTQKGSITVYVIILIAIMGLGPLMLQLISRAHREVQHDLNGVAQAQNVARGGLVDTIAWFRKHQPVSSLVSSLPYPDAAFAPHHDTDPLQSETMDPSDQSLVKEYSLSQSSNLWARYVVKKQLEDFSSDSSKYDPYAAHDITSKRIPTGVDGQGTL